MSNPSSLSRVLERLTRELTNATLEVLRGASIAELLDACDPGPPQGSPPEASRRRSGHDRASRAAPPGGPEAPRDPHEAMAEPLAAGVVITDPGAMLAAIDGALLGLEAAPSHELAAEDEAPLGAPPDDAVLASSDADAGESTLRLVSYAGQDVMRSGTGGLVVRRRR